MTFQKGRFSFFSFLAFLALGLTSCLMSFYDDLFSPIFATFFAFSLWCLSICYFIKNIEKGIFSLACCYLVLLGLFHLGLVIPFSIGIELKKYPYWLTSPYINKSLFLCSIAFSFYTASVILSNIIIKPKYIRNMSNSYRIKYLDNPNYPLLVGGLLLNLSGTILIVIGIIRLGLLNSGYNETYSIRMTEDPRLFGLGFMLVLMGAIITVAGSSRRQISWLLFIVFLPTIPLFLSGFRGQVVVYFASLLIIWYNYDSRKTKKVAVLAFTGIIILAPAIKIARNVSNMPLIDAVKEVQVLDLFIEAGGSMFPLVETVNEIDGFHSGYWWGQSYLMGIARVLPNLNSDWKPQDTSNQLLPPNHWITQRVDPWLYAKGGGLGFSGIAEPYLNFGIMGLILFFSALGYSLQQLESKYQSQPYSLAIIMCAYSALLWTTRNDVTNFFRPAIWSWIFVSVISFIFVKRTPKNRRSIFEQSKYWSS